MVFPLLVVILHIAAKDKQRTAESGQENVFVVVGANRYIVGQADGFLAKQGATAQLHQQENAAKLVQVIDTVLQVFPALAVFLETFKAGLGLLDGLFDFAFDQIKRLRFRRQRRLNHKRFLLPYKE